MSKVWMQQKNLMLPPPCKHEVTRWEDRNRMAKFANALANILVVAGDRSIDDLQARDEIKQVAIDVLWRVWCKT